MMDKRWDVLSEPEKVAVLILEIGPWGLGHFDGCICSQFSIRNVDVDIACGKGTERGIRVSSTSGDYQSPRDFALIVEALCSVEYDGRGPLPVHVLDDREEIVQTVYAQAEAA